MAIKESSFCIVEFSLSPISKFIHSPNYVTTTSFQALVLTIGGGSVFHFNPLRPTVYGLWNRYCGASYNSNFTHSILHRGLEYPVLFYRWSLLSVEHTANCGAIVWLNGPSNVKFFGFSPPQFSCGEPRGLLAILDKPCVLYFFCIATTPRYALVSPLRACGVWVLAYPTMNIIAQILQLFIVVLCPRPKLCTGVSTVEFMYLWIARFHCSFLVLCIYTATTGHLLYLSQYTLFLVR